MPTSQNEHTGAVMQTKAANKEFLKNFDSIFGGCRFEKNSGATYCDCPSCNQMPAGEEPKGGWLP